MFESLLDPVLNPLLSLGALFTIFVVALAITLLTTVLYKYTTDQKLMKEAKADMKEMQKKLKKAKDDPKKMADLQKVMMEKNMVLMKNSFKPMLYTFIPLIIIFGWLNVNLGFYPLMPDTSFSLTAEFHPSMSGNTTLNVLPDIEILSEKTQMIPESGSVTWLLKGKEGSYSATISAGLGIYEKELIVSETAYLEPEKRFKNEPIKAIILGNDKLTPFGRSFNLLGWYPGWLVTYIVLSLIFSTLLRKLFGIA